MKRLRIALLSLLLALVVAPALAQKRPDPTPLQFRDNVEETRFHALAAELRCVMCQNQSLADSNAQIAVDLRHEILDLMHKGRSDQQIRDFLVARYGEFVLYRPEVNARTWLLWLAPLMFALGGGFMIWRLARRSSPVASGVGDTAGNAGDAQAASSADDSQEW